MPVEFYDTDFKSMDLDLGSGLVSHRNHANVITIRIRGGFPPQTRQN